MLGWSALYDDIELNGGDWIFERTNPKGAFPPGTTAEVKWDNSITWDAEISGADIKWRIEAEDCTDEIIPHGTLFVIWVHYPNHDTDTTDDYPWMRGRAYRTDMED